MKKVLLLIVWLTSAIGVYAEDLDSLYTQEMLRYGAEAPDFMIDSLSNTSLKSMRGRYVVLHFWASWCPDCRKDIPEINKLHEEFASDSVIFIHISFDTEKEKWLKYIGESGMDGLQLCEFVKMKESKTAQAYGIKWIPSMYVLNTEGKVILRTVMIEKLRKQLSHLDLSKVLISRSKRASSPTFPGGDNALKAFLASNVEYPRKASNTDGSISQVKVVSNTITVEDKLPFQKLAGDEKRKLREEVLRLFAEEGMRVIKKMPKWKPGVRYGMPLNFKIHYNNY